MPTETCRCGHGVDWHYDGASDARRPCQSCGCQAFERCLHEVVDVDHLFGGLVEVVCCMICGAESPGRGES